MELNVCAQIIPRIFNPPISQMIKGPYCRIPTKFPLIVPKKEELIFGFNGEF